MYIHDIYTPLLLRLSYNPIGDEGMEILATALEFNRTVAILQ